MTSKTPSKGKASKVATTNPKADEANIVLASELSSSLNLVAEFVWFEKALSELKSGAITAQGLGLTIQKSEETGQAPSIRSAHAPYFLLADKLRGLEGGENQTLKTLLSLAEGSARAFKKAGANEKVEKLDSFEVFVGQVEKAKADKADEKKRGEGKKTADEKKAEALKAVTPKKVTIKEIAVTLTIALDSGESIPQITLENLARALARRMKQLSGKAA